MIVRTINTFFVIFSSHEIKCIMLLQCYHSSRNNNAYEMYKQNLKKNKLNKI